MSSAPLARLALLAFVTLVFVWVPGKTSFAQRTEPPLPGSLKTNNTRAGPAGGEKMFWRAEEKRAGMLLEAPKPRAPQARWEARRSVLGAASTGALAGLAQTTIRTLPFVPLSGSIKAHLRE